MLFKFELVVSTVNKKNYHFQKIINEVIQSKLCKAILNVIERMHTQHTLHLSPDKSFHPSNLSNSLPHRLNRLHSHYVNNTVSFFPLVCEREREKNVILNENARMAKQAIVYDETKAAFCVSERENTKITRLSMFKLI